MLTVAQLTVRARKALCTRPLRTLTSCLTAIHRTQQPSSADYSHRPVLIQQRVSRTCSRSYSIPAVSERKLLLALPNGFFLDVTWEDSSKSRYPFIYLRDNCTCPDCLHPPSQQRCYDFVTDNISTDVLPLDVKLSADGEAVKIFWPDGHASMFDRLWLHDHQLRVGDSHLSARHFKLPPRSLWQAKDVISSFDELQFSLPDLLSKPEMVYKWLLQLHRTGLTFVTHVGTNEGMLKKLAEHIAFLKRTVYGETYFVENIPEANNLAYASPALPLHLDLPYLEHEPGVVFLHCLKAASVGGHTFFTDGFNAALHMQQYDPEMFRVLCEVDVTWHSKGFDRHSGMSYDLESKHPVFELNKNKQLVQVYFGFFNRASRLEVDPETARLFYKAFCRFHQQCTREDSQFRYRIAAGEMAVFDNRRIVHGRGELNPNDARRLEGGYCDWHDILSRLRVLHTQLHEVV